MPNWFSKSLSDLCNKLLVKCPETRLGCSKNYCADVRNHAWFSDINWQMLLKQEIEAPFKPDLKTFSNTSSTSQLLDNEINSSTTTANTDQYKSVFETF
jgi:protein kinase A